MRCCRCDGEGFQESLDEREQRLGIRDSCYHCCETGQCDCTASAIVNGWIQTEAWYRGAHEAERMQWYDPEPESWEEWMHRQRTEAPEVPIEETWGPFRAARLEPIHEEALQFNEALAGLGR